MQTARGVPRPHVAKMLHLDSRMPVVFIIARDWTLRAALRAELRELGIEALGLESADEAGRAVAAGQIPSVVVLEAAALVAEGRATEELVRRIPTILVASRTETVPLPPARAIFYRPVRIGEIVAGVRELLAQGHAA
jgi:hypothetical protein